MGFTDKLKNTIQDATSVGFEKIDEGSFNMKIGDKKNEIRKVEEEIGSKVYALYAEEKETFNDEIKGLCDKIKGFMDEIDDLEAQKKEKTDKAKAERQQRRDESE